ncbi:hypothetical protein RB4054 [Rhodopirellula baltica SH 1]|uniref:Uncharacterized protein n=1 Tax=Rhodopirellula baltica (strain DSM 10527 / NCIMB 13988 / SH1) TaxID=243090 RepID=Q7UT74_RHOBA|nr:hypothetical protein RB4054 [Rhodopirellula baltica SH 1]
MIHEPDMSGSCPSCEYTSWASQKIADTSSSNEPKTPFRKLLAARCFARLNTSHQMNSVRGDLIRFPFQCFVLEFHRCLFPPLPCDLH